MYGLYCKKTRFWTGFVVPVKLNASFYRPRKDERLSRPWSHPVVLNTGLLDWESSALITRQKPRISIATLTVLGSSIKI